MRTFIEEIIESVPVARMLKNVLIFLLVVLIGTHSGCRPGILSEKDYKAYLTDPDNGLLSSRMPAAHLKTSVQYMPPAYLAAQEMHASPFDANTHIYDSLKTVYGRNATFYLTIESADASLNLKSLMQGNTTDAAQLSAALSELDMTFPSGISLILEDKTYPPSLCLRVSAPGIGQKITFITVFPVVFQDSPARTCTLTWKDGFFQRSMGSFPFQLSDLKTTPDIQL